MKFMKFNNNPLGNKSGDCVIRAVSHALGFCWNVVYIRLNEIGIKQARMITDNEVLIEFLKDYEMTVPKIKKGEKRPKVKDFVEGNFILSIAKHLTCVKDNTLIDLWDCRNKSVYRYWEIK